MGGWDGTGLPHRPDWTYEVMSSSPGPLSPRLLATLAVVLVIKGKRETLYLTKCVFFLFSFIFHVAGMDSVRVQWKHM